MKVSYNNNFNNCEKDITIEDLAEIEEKYGFDFPEDIRNHYLSYNGGEPEKYIFIDEGYKYIIQHFLPIKHKKTADSVTMEYLLDSLKEEDEILPEWLVPFADDPGGNLYCFSLDEEEKGSIYYWDHDYEYGEDPEQNVGYLTSSLKDFIDAMTEDK